MLTITLPLPPKELSPNARVHWRVKALKVKGYRQAAMEEAMVAARDARMEAPFSWVRIKATFFHTQNRGRDADNALASLKSAFDGLADAGIVTNDRKITHEPVEFMVDRERPRVELEIFEIKGEVG